MRIWLELNAQEAERIFDSVKEFAVDRMQTGILKAKKEELSKAPELPEKSESPESNTRGPKKSTSLEKVRAVLAEKSQAGKKAQVKELIARYGAEKLTEIDPVNYPQLLQEADAL
jgi:hypothetical protein